MGYNGYGQLGNGKTDSTNTELRDVQNLKNVVQVVGAQNGHFGAAVRTDGTVWAWGLNTYGQLGNSKNENSSIPVSVGYPPTTNFDVQYAEVQKSETGTTVRKYEDSSMPRSLSGGEAIAEDEQIVIDTSKLIGEQIFGFNLITDKSSSYSNAKDIEISSFDETLFTIKNGNTIVPNQNGKYGTGVVIIRDTDPTRNFVGIIRVQVKPKDAVATPMVSAKQSSTVALKADGTVWTWGYNVAGQLGNNSTADSLIPVQVLGGATGNQYLTNVVQVAAGGTFDGGNRYYALALRENGTVWAWGDNSYGQLGIGVKGNPTDSSKTSCLTPMQVVTGEQDSSSTYLEDIIQISAGPTFAMALDRKGNVYTWGQNNVGQLGNNTNTDSNAPVRVSGGLAYTVYLGDVIQIAAGGDWVNGTNDFAVVLRKDGSVMTWGQNSNGQLGNKSYTSSLTPIRPVGIDGDTDKGLQNVVQITAGGVSAGVVTTDRKAYTWGYNAQRQLGVDTSASTVNVPTVVKTDASTELSDVVEIAAGMQQMSARVIEDASADPFTKVYAWGNNSYGQLGLNKSDATYVYATRVVGGETKKDYLEDTVSLYAGGYHMGSVQSDYSVWDWGYNINGQLGDGTTDRRKAPVKVVSDMGQPQLTISTATWTNNGVDNDVVIYYDTLKMQNTSKIVTSIQEEDILSIDLSGISGVSSFNLLRASAYTPDDLTFKSVDTEVATVDAKTGVVTAKKTGITYIIVTDKNGAEGFFKLNVEPQGTNYIAYPQVQPGFYHTVALKADGTVWAWGYNAHGELGIGTAGGDHDHPEQVLRKENQSDPDSNNVPLTNIVKIAVGAYHNLALTADGQVYAWGWGIYGSLGDGDTSDHSSTVAMRVVGTGYSNNNTNTYLGDGNGSDFIVDIGAGGYSNYASYSMALDIKGTLYTWGRNYKSVIDPKNTSDSYVTGVPVNITKNNSMLNGAVRINSDAIGHIGSVLRSDGQIVSWGYNGYGSAGNGTTSDRITTTQADLNGKKALYAKHGWHNAVAITTDGLVMMWGYAGYGTTGLGNSTTNKKPTVVADYSKHNYEQAIETMSADSIEMQADDSDDTSLKKVSVNLVMKNGEASTALGVLSDEAPADADALYEVELPLGAVSATPVVFATSKNATVQFYNVEMTALDGTVFTEGDDTSYAGASLNTYNVATSGNDKFEQLVKVHVESASGIGADYLIKLINYPSTTITASPVFADASLSSVVLMTDGRLYTSGQAGIYATGQGPNSKFGVVGNVLAGDSGEEGTYLEDIINAAVTADERPGQSMYAIKSNGSVWAWGNNSYYKLGNGSNKDESTPVRVGASYLTMSQYLYSLKVNGGSVTIPAPSVDSFNVFNSNNGGKTDAKLLWQTYDGNNNIITVNPDTGEITPVGVGTTYVIVSIANDPLTTGLVKVEVRPSDLTVGKTSVAYPQVAAGTDFTVALKADGTVWTWGQNTYGQLGNGVSNGTVVYPEKIDSLSDIIKIAAAGQTAVALKTDGTVWTWGRNDNGQLGNGTTVSSNVPVQVLKGEQNQGNADKTYLENIVAIDAGGLNDEKIFVVALDSNGNVYGFGSNEYRQLKIANDASYNTPVVSPAVNAVDVAAGRGATVYTLTSNGLVYALGKNYAYEYGTGGTSGSVYTLVPLDNRAMAIGAGNQNGIAVTYSLDASSKPSTKTYAWGNNAYYAISPNNTSTLRTPTEMLGRDNTAIIGGGDSIYTIDKDSQLKISGLGDHGQLANGSEDNSTSMVPYSEFAKNDGTTATDAIGASSSRNGAHSLYIDSNGSVWSVGDNTSSQLALQNAGDKINVAQMIGAEPTILVKEREILAKIDKQQNIGNIIDIKGSFNLFSSADAAATYSQEFDVWDSNVATVDSNGIVTGKTVGQTYVQIKIKDSADNVINTLYVLVSVVPDKDEYVTYPMVEAGQTFTVALKANGTVWSWGNNASGQLGLGYTGGMETEPRKVMSNIKKIAVGDNFVMALDFDGHLWTWGVNNYGQLGQGLVTSVKLNTPQMIQSFVNNGLLVTDISVGGSGVDEFALAITDTMDVYGWGKNYNGQIKSGSAGYILSPIYTGVSRAIAIAGGRNATSYSLAESGRVYAWGYNGSIEHGTSKLSTSVVAKSQVSIDDKVVAIAAGYGSGFAITENKETYVWGKGVDSQLGVVNSDGLPRKNNNIDNVIRISGARATFAIKENGKELLATGKNDYGMLGVGSTNLSESKFTNVKDENGTNNLDRVIWADASNNGNHSAVIKTDGDVYAWGLGTQGQIGNGGFDNSNYPTAVGTKKIKLTGITNNEITTYEGAPSRSFIPSIVSGFNVFEDHITDIGTFRIASTDTNVVTVGLNNQLSFVGVGKANIVVADKDTSLYALIEVNVLPADYQSAVDNGTAVFPKIDAGDYFSIALKADGTVWTWGENTYGELGINDKTVTQSGTPVQVVLDNGSPLEDVIDISANIYAAYALTRDGSIYAWGRNYYAALGQGTGSDYYQYYPIKVKSTDGNGFFGAGLSNKAVKIRAGVHSAIVIMDDGTAYAWGYNNYGNLGTNGANNTLPNKIIGVNNAFDAEVGTYSTAILNRDSTVFTVGYNGYGERGVGNTSNSSLVQKMQKSADGGEFKGVVSLGRGDYHGAYVTFELKDNITDPTDAFNNYVYSTGINTEGITGTNTTNWTNVYPVRVTTDGTNPLTDISQITAGYRFHVALTNTADANVYAWGITM